MRHIAIEQGSSRTWLLAAALLGGCGEAGGDGDTGGSAGADTSGSTGADTGGSMGADTGEAAATPIVLVHGAWMGAWAWDDVVPHLEEAGHAVFVVDLPAHGEDATAAADASLAGYRDAVLGVLDGIGAPAALVGHSMGGMVISEVAEARPAAIDTLVYVAAFLPQDGQSLFDIAGTDTGSMTAMHIVDHGDGTASIDPAAMGDVFCGDCSEAAVATLLDRTRPEPLAPLLSPAGLGDAFGGVRRTYVHTEQDLAVSYGAQQAMVAASPVDGVRTLQASHSPFLSQPQALADAIVELVESP